MFCSALRASRRLERDPAATPSLQRIAQPRRYCHPPPSALKTAIWSCTKAASELATAPFADTTVFSEFSKSRLLMPPAENSLCASENSCWASACAAVRAA